MFCIEDDESKQYARIMLGPQSSIRKGDLRKTEQISIVFSCSKDRQGVLARCTASRDITSNINKYIYLLPFPDFKTGNLVTPLVYLAVYTI